MTDRVIEIASPARLSVRHAQLVIEQPPKDQLSLPFTTPINEIAVLLLAHPQITLSQAVLSEIASAGGAVVTIDGKFLPVSMLLPLQAHSLQTERFAAQVELSLPTRKRLWQSVVKAKIRAQADLLQELHGTDGGLLVLASQVRSGDPTNIEARAARRYWSLLFGTRFRRGSGEEDRNRHLDYGYTVLRASVARALCAAGLHPSLGLHHKNRYNAFCLAADLMEPFRPLIDRHVAAWITTHDETAPLDGATKRWLIQAMTARYRFEHEDRTCLDLLLRTASSLANCIAGESRELALPYSLRPTIEIAKPQT